MTGNTNINFLEIDAVDMDFTNLVITPTQNGLKVSGSYIYVDVTYTINTEFSYPDAPDHDMITEWNLYFWTTDHSWHLDVGAMKYPPEDPYGVVNIAFGWMAGKQCNKNHDKSIWHIRPLPMDENNRRPTHGVTSDGSHYHHDPKNKGIPVLVSGPTVIQ